MLAQALKELLCNCVYKFWFVFLVLDEPPANTNYKHPESAGFVGGRNFYLKTEDGATLGVWLVD